MAESDLVSMAQAFTGLPMGELIGGPLMAACDANNKMAMTQANYILQTGFTYVPNPTDPKLPGTYKVVEIEMELSRPVLIPGTPAEGTTPAVLPSIETVVTTVKVPLISMIPIPTLGIDKVAVTFDMEVKSSYGKEVKAEQEKKIGAETSFEAKFGSGPFSVSIKGNASYSQTDKSSTSENIQKSNSANYHVEVSASQQPQPPGLAVILQEFAKNVGPFVMPSVAPVPVGGGSNAGPNGTPALPGSRTIDGDPATARATAQMLAGATSV